ncbi:hypothetical protein HAZT_HAZT001502 [Hyalella azteca]|uniref:C3H1-type domain-containing protein n=1 Tax=Hyalella azteca TaxID=294128 RepID=A0A6A0GTQ9_HYAAZ|nr:hypothetical protein HAZT_HAZT001502 [Hyalella azteca]
MHIEDVDALREWLTSYLAPLCDADPPALARYCIALIRKDKPTPELVEDMLQQLDVFLQDNTASFVEKFLIVVEKKSYMPKKNASAAAKPNNAMDSSLDSAAKPEVKSLQPRTLLPLSVPPLPPKITAEDETLPVLRNGSNGTVEAPVKSGITSVVAVEMPTGAASDAGVVVPPLLSKKDDVKTRKDDREGGSWRGRSRDRRRSRSRGRGGPSSRVAKHDERPRRRFRRSWSRSPSPSPRSRSPRHTRYSRTSPSRGPRNRSPMRRSRSPRRSTSPKLRSRSPKTARSRSPKQHSHSPLLQLHSPTLRSRSRSPLGLLQPRSPLASCRRSPLGGRRSRSPLSRRRSRSPLKGSNGGLLALPDSPIGGQSPVLADTADQEELSPDADMPHTKLSSGRRKKHRCKDYDEKGYCMRGDQCPYDHGADPVVLDFPPSTPYTAAASLPPDAAAPLSQAGGLGANLGVPPPPHLAGRLTRPLPAPSSDPLNEYTPSDPILWGNAPSSGSLNTSLPPPHFYGKPPRGGMMMMGPPPPLGPSNFLPIHHPPPSLPIHMPPPPFVGHPLGARELINVTTANGGLLNKGTMRTSLAQRLGPPSGRGPNKWDNCSIELRKVPRFMNSITHLNSHFQKFGKIVNMQIQFEGDPEAAVITFSKHSEANAAYRCTEAVLNNRFIKVLWHGGQGGRVTNPSAPITTEGGMIGPALGSTAETESATALPDSSTATEGSALAKPAPPKLTAQEIKQQQIELIMQQQQQLAEEVARRQQEEKRKADAAKLKDEVRERTQQLLDKQLQQLKLLLSKMESSRTTATKAERLEMLNAIKTLQSSIETTKQNLKASFPSNKIHAFNLKSRPATVLPQPTAPTATTETPVGSKVAPAVPGANDAAQVVAKGSTELTKKILDTEMDVYAVAGTEAKNGKAGDAVVKAISSAEELKQLKTKLAQLKANARQLTSMRGRGHSVAMRGTRGVAVQGRGRKALPSAAAAAAAYLPPTEKTSCKLHASGFEPEDKDAVLTHFASLGNVISFLWDGLTPSVTVEYSTRRHAEKAFSEGRMMGDRLMTLTWVSEHKASALPPVPSTQQYQDRQFDPASMRLQEEDDDDDDNIFEHKTAVPEVKPRAPRPVLVDGSKDVTRTTSKMEKQEPQDAEVSIVDPRALKEEVEIEKKSKPVKHRLLSESSLVLHDELLLEGDEEVIDCDDEDDEREDSSWKR